MDDFQLAELLIAVVARVGGVKEKRLRGRGTPPTLCKLRDTARFLIRQRTRLSYPEIARLFNQDHSSVIAAVQREQLRLDRGLPHLPSGLTWSAWHTHILALLDQDIAGAKGKL